MQVHNPNATYPIMGALYHPPGGIIRHDAVVWGLARSADQGGAEIHQNTEVLGMERSNGKVTKVKTNRGTINAGQVLNCTAGWSTLISDMAGVAMPITTHILQACVTEPMKPLLDVVIVSSQMHVYLSQTDRGEFLMGAEIEPWTTYRMNGTLNFLQDVCRHALELFPQLERARLLRSWAGLCDLSPDYSPILGKTEVDNFHVSAGLGDLRVQGRPDRRQDARRAGRHRTPARPDRAVCAGALLRGQPRVRARRRRRQPLIYQCRASPPSAAQPQPPSATSPGVRDEIKP